MTAKTEDKLYKGCEAVMRQLISDEADTNNKVYADEFDLGLATLSSCLTECIDNDVMFFNRDTAKGIIYCLTAQFACIKTSSEANYDTISEEIVGLFNIGKTDKIN